MRKLTIPEYTLKIRSSAVSKQEVFDMFRKKFVSLTPEEWVRQQFLQFLIIEKKYPASLIAVEKGLIVNQLQKRFDAVVFNKKGQPIALLEFKSPVVRLDQKVFDQIAAYNLRMKVKYLIISNGLQHYCCSMDYEKQTFRFLEKIPDFNELNDN